MTYTLYIYEHCPYCVKARMIFGLKDVPLKLQYVLNDDENTPTALIGKKMVPILQDNNGPAMPESMDIIRFIDKSHGSPIVTKTPINDALEYWFVEAKNYIYPLAMPRWVQAEPALPEFVTPGAVNYFTTKKEAYLGDSFANLLAHSNELIKEMNFRLKALAEIIMAPQHVLDTLSEYDFHLYAALHSLSIVKGLEYPEKVEAYRRHFEKAAAVPLLDNLAR